MCVAVINYSFISDIFLKFGKFKNVNDHLLYIVPRYSQSNWPSTMVHARVVTIFQRNLLFPGRQITFTNIIDAIFIFFTKIQR